MLPPYSRRRFLRQATAFSCLAQAGFAETVKPAEPTAKPTTKPAPKPAKQAKPAKNPYADGILVPGPPPALTEGAFTIAVLPDTQYYCQKYAEGFEKQVAWILEHQKAHNIACVLHLGDVTNNNTPEQWEVATRCMKQLDGQVPYFMAPGNHDYSKNGGCTDRQTDFSKYFPPSHFKGKPSFGGVYDKEPEHSENSYHFFTASGRKYLVICLEFGPRADVVRWANEIVKKHSDRAAILVTHAYTYWDNSRFDWKKPGTPQQWSPHGYGMSKATKQDILDGEELWKELVSKNDNFIFTINGHVVEDGLGRLTSQTPTGRDIHQILVNFQMRPRGGDGWLRLLEVRKDGTMQTCDYSPWRNERNEGKENLFSVKLAGYA